MTTLNTILKESKEEYEKRFGTGSHRMTFFNERDSYWNIAFKDEMWSFMESLAKRVEEETIQNLRNVSRQRRQVILFPEKVSLLKSPEKERQRVRHWYHRKINKFFEDCPKCNVEMNKRMIIQNTSVDLLKQSEEKKGVK